MADPISFGSSITFESVGEILENFIQENFVAAKGKRGVLAREIADKHIKRLAKDIQDHVVDSVDNQQNAYGEALGPYTERWAKRKAKMGAPDKRGFFTGTLLKALASRSAISRVKLGHYKYQPPLLDRQPPRVLPDGYYNYGSRFVWQYAFKYNATKAKSRLIKPNPGTLSIMLRRRGKEMRTEIVEAAAARLRRKKR